MGLDLNTSSINQWSASVRHMWNLPMQSHRYLIKPLGGTHLKTMLYYRFLKFIKSIETGHKLTAKVLLEIIKDNTETITGRNMKKILMETDQSNISNIDSKTLTKFKFSELPETEEWRINIIKELTDIKQGNLSLDFDNDEGMKSDEIENILAFLTTS